MHRHCYLQVGTYVTDTKNASSRTIHGRLPPAGGMAKQLAELPCGRKEAGDEVSRSDDPR
jgi:hypothetical protein